MISFLVSISSQLAQYPHILYVAAISVHFISLFLGLYVLKKHEHKFCNSNISRIFKDKVEFAYMVVVLSTLNNVFAISLLLIYLLGGFGYFLPLVLESGFGVWHTFSAFVMAFVLFYILVDFRGDNNVKATS